MKNVVKPVHVVVFLAIIGLIVVGLISIYPAYNRAMFEPTPQDHSYAASILENAVGSPIEGLSVPRVNRDINAVYFLLPANVPAATSLKNRGTRRADLPPDTFQLTLQSPAARSLHCLIRFSHQAARAFGVLVPANEEQHKQIAEKSFGELSENKSEP